MSFYKFENNELTSGNYICGDGYDLNVPDHHSGVYTYPYYDWYWFDTEEEANAFFNIGVIDGEG